MTEERGKTHGYVKLLALSIDHFESRIIMERNTNSQADIDAFTDKYRTNSNIIVLVLYIEINDHEIF